MGECARAAESALFAGERRRAEDACDRATSTGCPGEQRGEACVHLYDNFAMPEC